MTIIEEAKKKKIAPIQTHLSPLQTGCATGGCVAHFEPRAKPRSLHNSKKGAPFVIPNCL